MAEIIELIAADHLHIMRWQVRLADLRRHRSEPGCAPELAVTWDTLAALIDLHMAADEAVCGRPATAPGRLDPVPAPRGLRPAGRRCRRRASPALRARLGRQWRAFMDGQIRGRYQAPPPQVPTCQLRQAQLAATVPRLADPAFAPLACACPACTRELDPVSDVARPSPAVPEPVEFPVQVGIAPYQLPPVSPAGGETAR